MPVSRGRSPGHSLTPWAGTQVQRTLRRVCAFSGLCALWVGAVQAQSFVDKSVDPDALPRVPDEFVVTLFAREPLVRQPCSLAFDERGRLFVGMGPQYRSPTPETPGDSVVIVHDDDHDGRADRTTVFATGFNAIQGLAWHGGDLWVANAPDLTIVRDADGDDGHCVAGVLSACTACDES